MMVKSQLFSVSRLIFASWEIITFVRFDTLVKFIVPNDMRLDVRVPLFFFFLFFFGQNNQAQLTKRRH